ncbi:alpha/beta hydrolase [Streptomyces sp. 142MFCol3.1]|uniref:alpha/beta hydrolase n=1 Tax=Streptomyces sp. 142MFCol3.1 TaxID=1172179 RepID=UPI000687589C|nr:alpha/beta hydrolase [Streptomyces sp. 142MFCol3.1]
MPDHVFKSKEPAGETAEEITFLPSSDDWMSGMGSSGPVLVDRTQSDVEERWAAIFGGPKGSVAVRMVRPKKASKPLPAVLYLHGGRWGIYDKGGHDRLIRELAVGAQAAVLYPEYTLAPKASYGIALEECCAVARWVTEHGSGHGMDHTRLAVVGHSVGGNMSAALTLLAKERGAASFALQVLLYPLSRGSGAASSVISGKRAVTRQFREQSTTDAEQHAEIFEVLQANARRLSDLPPALVVTADSDVLQDAGQAYADKLGSAGVVVSTVRCGRAMDDLVLPSARAPHGAISHVVSALKEAFAGGC